jgi:YbgC/YbaW family acyl-CoA thioester hydrolase
MPTTFHTTRRVEFADTDMAGIIHFTRFFNYMEEAEHAFLRSRGLSVVMTHEGRRIGWPRVAASCDFVRPVRFEDVVEIQVKLARVGVKSLSYEFTFEHQGDLVARGKLTTCCCEVGPDGMKGIQLPADIRQVLERQT